MRKTKENKARFGIPPVTTQISTLKDEKLKKIPISIDEIIRAKQRAHEKLEFSFKFLNCDHQAFNLGSMEKRKKSVCGEWFISLLSSLKEVSNINRSELVSMRQHYETHGYDWDNLDYKFDFPDEFLEQVECMQFRLSSSDGRVHGFIVGNTFYIVWLDPHHNLYPDDRFGGRKFYMKAPSCYDKLKERWLNLNDENRKLKRENQDLIIMIDDLTDPSK